MLGARCVGSTLDALTEREQQVLALIAEGLPNKLIAPPPGDQREDCQGPPTSAFRAIRVDDRMQAGMWARRHGL